MAAPVCQFVDRVGSGAVQRLNLNDGEKLTLLAGPDQRPGPDFSPPALKRAVVNTLMVEGASIPASAYDNRVIRLPLRVKACDEAEMAEILESLHRELDRGNNILKWHPTYNSRSVYFRTFRSPDYRLDQTMEGRGELNATLAILAEPFAYGDYIEQTGTIYSDPAAVANGIHFEIATTEGDIPTPLFLYVYDSNTIRRSVLAVRRHGTPALYWSQAEAMAQMQDTAIQANDPLMSGAGMNWSRTTFIGVPGWANRLFWTPVPAGGSSIEWRGMYRVFVRVRKTVAGDDIRIQMQHAVAVPIVNDPVTLPNDTNLNLIDVGLMSIPVAADPIYDGYSNVQLPVTNSDIRFHATRVAGTGNLDWDYAVMVPADEELVITDRITTGSHLIYDGPNDIMYIGDLAVVYGIFDPIARAGSIPQLQPNQTNLLVFMNKLDNTVKTEVVNYTARWWPRHLYIR